MIDKAYKETYSFQKCITTRTFAEEVNGAFSVYMAKNSKNHLTKETLEKFYNSIE